MAAAACSFLGGKTQRAMMHFKAKIWVRPLSSYCHPSYKRSQWDSRTAVTQGWAENKWTAQEMCDNILPVRIFSSHISVTERQFDKSLTTFMLLFFFFKKRKQGSWIARWNVSSVPSICRMHPHGKEPIESIWLDVEKNLLSATVMQANQICYHQVNQRVKRLSGFLSVEGATLATHHCSGAIHAIYIY